MSIIRSFGFKPGTPEWGFANDGVLAPEWSEHKNIVDQYFKFAVVRNPWDRFVSGWKYLPATRDRPLLDVLQNLPSEGHDYRHLTRQQNMILYDDAQNLAVDQLLRYENLQADFSAVCEKIGLEAQLPWLNGRRHPSRMIARLQFVYERLRLKARKPPVTVKTRESYRTYFNDESRALFAEKFADDIKLFGYEF